MRHLSWPKARYPQVSRLASLTCDLWPWWLCTRIIDSHVFLLPTHKFPYSGDAGAGTLKTVVALGAAAAAAVFVLLRKK